MRNRELDELRAGASELENHYIDEYLAGEISRRELFRLGTAVGMSVPLLGLFGDVSALAAPRPAAAKAGGDAAGGQPQAGGRDRPGDERHPGDPGGDEHHGRVPAVRRPAQQQPAPGPGHELQARQNRQGVDLPDPEGRQVHRRLADDGDDVVATFERLVDPANASSALSAFKGVLSKGGTQKTGDYTVVFHLDAPNPSFPYL